MGQAHAPTRPRELPRLGLSRGSLSALVQAGGALIALAVVVAFGALILAARHQRAESRAVEDTGRTVAQVERVQKLALDLETGLRGFVITGQDGFLAPYDAARTTFAQQARRLAALVAAKPTQHALAQRVLDEGRDYVRAYAAPLIATRRRSVGAAQDPAATAEGKRRMDALRGDLGLLVAAEQQVGAQERREADRDAGRTMALGAGGLAASLLLLVAFVVFVRRRVAAPLERGALAAAQLEAAESASQAKNEFLSRMSHELRTPLNSVLGFGQLLQLDPKLDDGEREHVNHIVRGGQHLLELINEVLDISRIESGTLSLSPESVGVGDAVREVVALVSPLAAEREIELTVEPTCVGYVMADHQRLKQVLLNLLSNAIKYNRHAGRVMIRCKRASAGVALEVADTGPGIPADRLPGLFEPFDRLGAEHRGIEGTGLGLALSRSLVEVMGGTLTAESRPGEGAAFTVTLPVAPAPAELAPVPVPVDPDTALNAARVLYVEDNTANFRLVEELLTSRRPVEILPAIQGRLGVELARRHRPDLILLDLHLPDMPGTVVLAQLKADPATERIPVLIVTADATPGRERRLLDAGAFALVTKPFDVPAFLRTVEAALAS
jgi:signal transduction histidine kinase/CheY-like chemotaxis protein